MLIACNVKHAQCYTDIMYKFCSYQVLNQVTPNPKGVNCDAAVKNKAMNRSMDYLPGEILHVISPCVATMNSFRMFIFFLVHTYTANKHRVILKQGHPDYIHASFVNVSYVIT